MAVKKTTKQTRIISIICGDIELTPDQARKLRKRFGTAFLDVVGRKLEIDPIPEIFPCRIPRGSDD